MTDKPQITNIDEAKAALDAEIKDAEFFARLYREDFVKAQRQLARYEEALYRLKGLRKRMDPPEEVEAHPLARMVQADEEMGLYGDEPRIGPAPEQEAA